MGQPVLATVEAAHGFDRPDLGLEYFRTVEKEMRSLLGVSTTAWMSIPPGASAPWNTVTIEPPNLPRHRFEMNVIPFLPGTLQSVVMPPLAGRMFGGADTPQTCKFVVVNEAAARVLWDGEAVGRSIEDPAGERVQIIGVVSSRPGKASAGPVHPAIYYYAEQTGTPAGLMGPATFRISERPQSPSTGVLDARTVSSNYFQAMGLSTVAGGIFTADPEPGNCRVGVINQEAADLYFGGDAVGGAVIDSWGRRTEIIGVVESALLRFSQRRIEPAIFTSVTQDFVPRMTLVLGTPRADERTLESIRRRLEVVTGGRLLPGSVMTLEDQLTRTSLATKRIATMLVGVVSAIALA